MFSKISKFIFTHFFDNKIRTDYKSYIFQSLLIFICISSVLLLNNLFDKIIVASLGASSFILFVTPHTNSSSPRYAIGGYFCGSISGLLFNYLYFYFIELNFIGTEYILIFVCAMAVAVATFLMVTTNLEHPPSAALALGLTSDERAFKTALAAIISIIILSIIKQLLKKHLKNLL